jgi:hypothetical protein
MRSIVQYVATQMRDPFWHWTPDQQRTALENVKVRVNPRCAASGERYTPAIAFSIAASAASALAPSALKRQPFHASLL